MNQNLGLIGTKLGNTQIFSEDGTVQRVTAIRVGPCKVLGKRTPDVHGYAALQLGFGTRRDKRVRKPEKGHFDKLGVTPPRVIREFRVPAELLEQVEVGQDLRATDVFREGMLVDVSGTSKGRGFTGVIKRHKFAGAGSLSHGTHEYKRHGGSIGMAMTPGRTLPGTRMPGHHGNKKVTVLNLRVAQLAGDDDVVLVEGGVPGPKNGVVTIRGAVKQEPVTPPLVEQSSGQAEGDAAEA